LIVILISLIDLFHAHDVVGPTESISEMTVKILITVHSKERDSTERKYFIHQTSKIITSII